ncbi:NAD(P)-binding protein [Neolentinus lepideus HHB14362 ss-1]|uniref:NAD(P)-binding protein n=1 Tax=Neolentinus lepideus HHB14362 ss-1 TaxID=1314782 RepID=A0A165TRC4_9AGAM|nr:NAD(P)-binding protein [Neolentinus lepideus HHB14362 ss-1]
MEGPRPIIIVTGANSGIGFGICQRLLLQLSQTVPPDAHPQFHLSPKVEPLAVSEDGLIYPVKALTLVMACRSMKKAEVARTELLHLLDTEIEKRKRRRDYDGHAEVFRKNLLLEIRYLDLSKTASILKFGDEINQNYPFVSHLICNAGVVDLIGLVWGTAIKEVLTSPLKALTAPSFYRQSVGQMSGDGLGWVWQCNVFGHYMLYRTLQRQLSSIPDSLRPARVIWTSSLEGHRSSLDLDDYQLLRTDHSYEASKYQAELIGIHLSRQTAAEGKIRHLVVHPGVVHTNVFAAALTWFTDTLKILAFYVARALGSRNHPITPLNGAISAVHLCLVSLSVVPLYLARLSTSSPKHNGSVYPDDDGNGASPGCLDPPVKFGSETDRWGHPEVGFQEIKGWRENEGDTAILVERCERLYRGFVEAEGRTWTETQGCGLKI